jgi:hypothetical protein
MRVESVSVAKSITSRSNEWVDGGRWSCQVFSTCWMQSLVRAAVAVSTLAACTEPHDATFSYGSFVEMSITTPMMLGDEEEVIVSGTIPKTVSVESTTPSSILVTAASRLCLTNGDAGRGAGTSRLIALNDACTKDETASIDVTVRAIAEGTSELRIEESDGSVWGSVMLSVEKAASLAFACNTAVSVTLAVDGYCDVTWKTTDADGHDLMSTSGVLLTSSDATVVTLFDGKTISGALTAKHLPFGDVSMSGIGPGDATVTATAGGAIEILPVHVN